MPVDTSHRTSTTPSPHLALSSDGIKIVPPIELSNTASTPGIQAKALTYPSMDNASAASNVFEPPPFNIHRHHQQLAKLRRHLGEDIPVELVTTGGSGQTQGPTTPLPHDPIKLTKKRRSLDLSALVQLRLTSPRPMVEGVSLKRRLSIWRRSDAVLIIKDREDALEAVQPPHNEPRRTSSKLLKVRRARKMVQLFGSDPPQVLYTAEDISTKASRCSTADLPEEMHGGGHRSSQSLLGTVLEHDDPPTDAEEALPPPVPTSPFATTEWPGSALSSSSSLSRSQSLSATTFGDRRRRAAKLCQFFGVDHQTLGLSLFATQNLHIPPMEEQESRNLTVGVRVNMPPRPWSRGGSEPDMKEVEVTDVIDKLRCMKAS